MPRTYDSETFNSLKHLQVFIVGIFLHSWHDLIKHLILSFKESEKEDRKTIGYIHMYFLIAFITFRFLCLYTLPQMALIFIKKGQNEKIDNKPSSNSQIDLDALLSDPSLIIKTSLGTVFRPGINKNKITEIINDENPPSYLEISILSEK